MLRQGNEENIHEVVTVALYLVRVPAGNRVAGGRSEEARASTKVPLGTSQTAPLDAHRPAEGTHASVRKTVLDHLPHTIAVDSSTHLPHGSAHHGTHVGH